MLQRYRCGLAWSLRCKDGLYSQQTEYIAYLRVALLRTVHQTFQLDFVRVMSSESVKETYFLVLRYALLVGAVETACFWLFPHQILSVFGSGAAGYEDFARRYMHIFMLLVILAGVPPISMNAMSSIKKPKMGILISMSKQLALILLLLLLPRIFAINGVLYAGPLADLLAACCSVYIIRKEFHQLDKVNI